MNSLTHYNSEILLYQTEDGHTRIEVQFKGETVWLSLNQMADLFQRDKSVISKHIRNVFEEGELSPDSTVAKFATVQTEGSRNSHEAAAKKAEAEYLKFQKHQSSQLSQVEKDFLLEAKRVERLTLPKKNSVQTQRDEN